MLFNSLNTVMYHSSLCCLKLTPEHTILCLNHVLFKFDSMLVIVCLYNNYHTYANVIALKQFGIQVSLIGYYTLV